ncbi:MAG: hypothetical protein ABIQ16_08520 [Polyangiaceae bacterium]
MNHENSILEELLARVKRNAALPRTLVSAAEPTAPIIAPTPAPYYPPTPIPPAYVAPQPESVYELEPPPFQPSFESYVPPSAPAHAALLDASVDDLLLEDPFPSEPAPPAPSYSDVFEEDPIPLVSVSVSSQRSHDEDVSGIMVVSELNDEPEELLEDDIVEMTAEVAAVPEGNPLDDLNFDDEELDGESSSSVEEPPASSSRSKIAGTMDEALARAADEHVTLEEGREVPLKTPPPESGPQAATALPPGIHAPLSPDIEELLEADIQPQGGVRSAVPTTEQVGQTIDLDEARGPSLELDHPAALSAVPLHEDLPGEELEVTLPGHAYGGGYAEDLMPPPGAREELEAHRQRVGDDSVPPPPESLAQFPSLPASAASADFAAPVIVPTSVTTDSTSEGVSMVTVDAPTHAEFAPELLARPALGPTPVAKFIRVQSPRPNTFLELLDASLSLGSD